MSTTTMTADEQAERLSALQRERLALNGSAADATPETWRKIAELHDEEARIWNSVWRAGRVERLLFLAAMDAERVALDAAQFWRRLAEGKAW